MNLEQARVNMITQQIRAWDVLDDETLNLLANVPRENFVPSSYRDLAFADMQIPLGEGQIMLPPKEEGKILQALQILPTDIVLEVGTGSGYMTALLASLAHHVYSVEISPQLMTFAQQNLEKMALNNVTLEIGDGCQGWDKHAPYDVIVITGSLPFLPDHFYEQLNIGGRLFAILGEKPIMQATLFTREDKYKWAEKKLFETVVPPLKNQLPSERFIF